MNLPLMYSLIQTKTYFSRSDVEIFAAINEGCHRMYQMVLKENRGYWIKWDTSTVQIVSGTAEYSLPADLEQILRVREQTSSAVPWRIVRHVDLTSESMLNDNAQAAGFYDGWYGGFESPYKFFGPYELASVAEDSEDDETYSIRFTPIPTESHNVEIVYSVKLVEVTNVNSFLIIPIEGRGAVCDYAIAELLKANGDDRAQAYYETAQEKMDSFLTLVRDRQQQDAPQVKPYLDDLD